MENEFSPKKRRGSIKEGGKGKKKKHNAMSVRKLPGDGA